MDEVGHVWRVHHRIGEVAFGRPGHHSIAGGQVLRVADVCAEAAVGRDDHVTVRAEEDDPDRVALVDERELITHTGLVVRVPVAYLELE